MKTCTFFGHRNTSENVSLFYVGNHGNFDRMVRKVLKDLKQIYPHITYHVVLAYLPRSDQEDYADTIYPDELELALPKYAIDKRNRWMLEQSDYVISYVVHTFGGAGKYKKIAEKRGKHVINLPTLYL